MGIRMLSSSRSSYSALCWRINWTPSASSNVCFLSFLLRVLVAELQASISAQHSVDAAARRLLLLAFIGCLPYSAIPSCPSRAWWLSSSRVLVVLWFCHIYIYIYTYIYKLWTLLKSFIKWGFIHRCYTFAMMRIC